ncbi:hypothetical protein PHJA_002241900 [Phtheirospermum japonicum]|uniref:Uncharacterized protein n=1 Tax=Phtheirospermum japonicum TaxID=374723 RepID=A0A830CPR9_9LAMI|nr:hypothetical protein PHJA_002241900 [Phtheirospermum japonicum]
MTSACRFAAMITRRSPCTRPNAIIKTLVPKPIPASAFSPSTHPFAALRFASVLGSLETMLPLHSTIAAARLSSSVKNDPDNLASADHQRLSSPFFIVRYKSLQDS